MTSISGYYVVTTPCCGAQPRDAAYASISPRGWLVALRAAHEFEQSQESPPPLLHGSHLTIRSLQSLVQP